MICAHALAHSRMRLYTFARCVCVCVCVFCARTLRSNKIKVLPATIFDMNTKLQQLLVVFFL